MTQQTSATGGDFVQGKGFEAIRQAFDAYVVPSYSRVDLSFDRGEGQYLFNEKGERFLDFGGGIAVNVLGHAHPDLTAALESQAKRLSHISNLYYHAWQADLAKALVERIGPGKCFFSNSGAEANEALFKLARRFGHEEGRFEILTMSQSFHGRTLAGMAATGQEKVKKGFGPMVSGFRHVAFNDLEAVRDAISPATVAVLVEGIQGEGGVVPASSDYLIGLRRLCDEQGLLLLMDEVQAGQYRTGRFMSYHRILEGDAVGEAFLPDAVAMAKGLGGGFPMGAMWVRKPYAELLDPSSHASTFGGNPLACSIGLKVLEVIERDGLAAHVRRLGDDLIERLGRLSEKYPDRIQGARGLGLLVGIRLADGWQADPNTARTPAQQLVGQLHQEGLLTVPAGPQVVRLLPALNVGEREVDAAMEAIESAIRKLSS